MSDLRRARIRVAAMAAILGSVGVATTVLVSFDAREIADSVGRVDGALLAALVGTIAALAVVAVPVSLIAASAGYLTNAAVGTAVALVGLSLGAMVCAALSRAVAGEQGPALLGERAERLGRWLRVSPFRSLMMVRLVPGLPFPVVSYTAGLVPIKPPTVGLATAVGFAPRCFLFATVGSAITDLDRPETLVVLVVSLVLLAAGFLVPRYLHLLPSFDERRDRDPR
jgi:uncharacterized membrane protein YdjX (TVP38/TMEM64 family)